MVVHSSNIHIDKSNAIKLSKYDQQWFKSFTNNATQLNSDRHINLLLANNKNWARTKNEEEPDFFKKLVKPQTPKFLYFGCADSRVLANEILGLGAGELFVHRNVGNLVPGNDLNALSVLEYAVTHLGVTDIVVTGHYDCGAVRASVRRQDLGLLENWLRLIRDVYRIHKDYLDLIEDEEERHLKLVELNVIEQCNNIYKTGPVQRKRMEVTEKLIKEQNDKGGVEKTTQADTDSIFSLLWSWGGKKTQESTTEDTMKLQLERLDQEVYPRIHGMVFNPKDGLLKKLPLDFNMKKGSLDHIYALYKRN